MAVPTLLSIVDELSATEYILIYIPVFFVGKKDGSKRMVIDYCNLNNQTVKNNYPLPLIIELIDNMGSKKVFTKMDLR